MICSSPWHNLAQQSQDPINSHFRATYSGSVPWLGLGIVRLMNQSNSTTKSTSLGLRNLCATNRHTEKKYIYVAFALPRKLDFFSRLTVLQHLSYRTEMFNSIIPSPWFNYFCSKQSLFIWMCLNKLVWCTSRVLWRILLVIHGPSASAKLLFCLIFNQHHHCMC